MRDGPVTQVDAIGGSAEEAPSVVDLEQVGDGIDEDERDRDDRQPRERDVVFEGEDRARLTAGG
jgi:hypothetical protein